MADNWDRLKAKGAPAGDAKLPAASYKTNHRSLPASKEKTDSNLAPAKAQKRSATPLPSSGGNKRRTIAPQDQLIDNPKPKALDAKLPEESVKKSNLKSMKSENPAVAKGKQVGFPLSSSNGQDPASIDIEELPFELLESSARGLLGPSGQEKQYLNQLQTFYKRSTAQNMKIAKRLHKLDVGNTKKHLENESLKNKVNAMANKMEKLEESLGQQKQLNKELEDKYLGALNARRICEMTSESNRHVDKAIIKTQKEELDKHQSEIENLNVQLKYLKETNHGLSKVYNDQQMKLKQANDSVAQLSNQNENLVAELEDQRLQSQQIVAELESELREKTAQLQELNESIDKYVGMQSMTDDLVKQLELRQMEMDKMQGLLDKKERSLEAVQISLSIELEAQAAKFSAELKAQKDASEVAIAGLNSTLSKQLQDLEEQAKNLEDLKAANLQQLSQHNVEIDGLKMNKIKLGETVNFLEEKLQSQAKRWQARKTAYKKKLDEMVRQNNTFTLEFQEETKRLKAKVEALNAELAEKASVSSVEQEKMQSLQAELAELKQSLVSLKDEKEQMANQCSSDIKNLKEEYEGQAETMKLEINGLEEALKEKDLKLIELEGEKNGIIRQLHNKMNTISSTIGKPIVTPMTSSQQANSKVAKKVRKVGPKEVSGTATTTAGENRLSSSKHRKSNRINIIENISDFGSEDEQVPIKSLFSKRDDLAVVKPRAEELFDALKNSAI